MESLLLRKKNRNKMFDRETLPSRLHRVRLSGILFHETNEIVHL